MFLGLHKVQNASVPKDLEVTCSGLTGTAKQACEVYNNVFSGNRVTPFEQEAEAAQNIIYDKLRADL